MMKRVAIGLVSSVVAAVAVIGIAAALGLAAVPHATPTGWLLRLRQVFGGLCALIAAAGLGAVAAQIRTQSVAQAPFAASEEPRAVEGWAIANDANDNGPRLRLFVRSIDGVTEPPRYARMSVSEAGLLTPGRAARCFGVLGPPSGPMASAMGRKAASLVRTTSAWVWVM